MENTASKNATMHSLPKNSNMQARNSALKPNQTKNFPRDINESRTWPFQLNIWKNEAIRLKLLQTQLLQAATQFLTLHPHKKDEQI
jgi:hypothetical protein